MGARQSRRRRSCDSSSVHDPWIRAFMVDGYWFDVRHQQHGYPHNVSSCALCPFQISHTAHSGMLLTSLPEPRTHLLLYGRSSLPCHSAFPWSASLVSSSAHRPPSYMENRFGTRLTFWVASWMVLRHTRLVSE
jgi:hypothetical protein